MTCSHSALMETIDTTTTEQFAFGEVVLRQRTYDVQFACMDCGEPVNPYDGENP